MSRIDGYVPMDSESDLRKSQVLGALSRVFPIIQWLPRYRWRELLLKDISCGITLGAVLIGQSLAHATLSAVDVIHGPYSCVLPPIMYAIFGTCSQASVGTGGLLALLTGIQLQHIGDVAERDHAAAVLCLLVGLILALMGIFQLSFLVRFLSRPALSGFITGSATLIIKAMLVPMLGLPKGLEREGLVANLRRPSNFLRCDVVTLALSLVSFLFLLSAKKVLPGKIRDLKELMVLVLSALFCYVYATKEGVETVGHIRAGLPDLVSPVASRSDLKLAKELLPGAVLIALVTFISSFASAKKCGMKGGYQVVAFNELLALGFANIAGAFSGGIPTQIGLSRSALALDMGVKTPLGSNVFVALVVAGIIRLFSPLLSFVPSCVLNAIIVNAAIGLFEFGEAKLLWAYHDDWRSRTDLGVWVASFLSTISVGAFEGILVAVTISLVIAIKEIVDPNMDILGQMTIAAHPEGTKSLQWVSIERYEEARQTPHVLVIRIDGPMFYANCERFQDRVAELERARARSSEPLYAVILNAASISFVDATAVQVLQEMVKSWRSRGVKFYIANAHGKPRLFFSRALASDLDQAQCAMTIDSCIEVYERDTMGELFEKPIMKEAMRRSMSICPLPYVHSAPLLKSRTVTV